ncbi:reticulon-like protein B11 [Andrographis paniculata]|uniref:reticulon-like protein B11 n=1 Tax=Andrographis paniculata TaxID=175694 RepID=UPI0021E7D1F3|nr:reticulon-like protein B11 [Andrographis paniculata]XP_051137807.1 reticulon-like protein B11 [Andrographis paniculata]
MGEPRQFSVHLALGGGAVADVLLWKKGYQSVTLLVVSTALWFIFETAGYNLLSFISNALFFLAVILFFWAKSAALLNRPLPPLPNLEVSEDVMLRAADETRLWVNEALSLAHDIGIRGNLRLAVQLAIGLWLISYIGSLFDFLTLAYIGVLLSLSMPVLYDNYQDLINEKMHAAYKLVQIQYRVIDEKVLSRISLPVSKEKKIQ